MSLMKNIEKFNTHTMSEETVLALVTGRDKLIKNISDTIAGQIGHTTPMQHIVLVGPRGMGKSFILRYFEIITKKENTGEWFIDFSLLPEEQPNITSPTEFIDELLARISRERVFSKSSLWDDKKENWESAVEKLNNKITEQKTRHKDYLFIAAVENLDVLIENVFSTDINQSRLRKLLTGTPNFMLFGTSKKHDIDNDYNKRLFHAFQKYVVEPWIEKDYLNYFNKRYELLKKENPDEFKNKDIVLLTNKLKAVSKFTGGSPRMAVVLTNLMFDEDAVTTAQTLNDTVENLTPYYQDLMEKMPGKSRILFDALVRSEENISQSEIAAVVGADQGAISQAFKWLIINNYVVGRKVEGEKQTRYAVADRVFVLFYYKRYIHCGIECNYIKVLSDFLISFYNTRELCEHSLKYIQNSLKQEGIEFAKMVFRKNKLSEDKLDWNNYEEISGELKKILQKEEVSEAIEQGNNKYQNKDFVASNDYYFKVYEIFKKENNIRAQAALLSLIGINYFELNQYEKAIECHQQAFELYEKDNNKTEQALNLEWLGLNYKEIKQFEKAIECHQQAFELCKQENDVARQLGNLGMLGLNYGELYQFEKAIECHQQAFELCKQENDVARQLWNLDRLGLNYHKLQQYEKAIECHQFSLELHKQKNDIKGQAVNLGELGLNYKELQQFEKAIECHQQAYELNKQENDVARQAWNLGRLGWNYKEIQQFEKAIECHKQAYELRKQENSIGGQAWNIGQVGCNYLFCNSDEAWAIFTDENYSKIPGEEIFREYGDAVIFKERWEDKASAFAMANTILTALKERNLNLNKTVALKNFFAGLLNMKISFGLLKDICNETAGMFSKEEDIVIRTILNCIEYIEAGKDERYLQKLNPDVAVAVKAIIAESGL